MEVHPNYLKKFSRYFSTLIRDVNGDIDMPKGFDVTILCSKSKNKIVGAHRVYLAAISLEFEEKLKSGAERISIETSYEAMMQFRQFFYTADIKLTEEHILAVIELIINYGHTDMIDVCDTFCAKIMNASNVIEIYEFALKNDLRNLKDICAKTIAAKIWDIITEPSFVNVERYTLKKILQLDGLQCCESALLVFVMHWAGNRLKASENKEGRIKGEIGDLIKHIHFRSMGLLAFLNAMEGYEGVFGAPDILDITRILSSRDFTSNKFCNEPRKPRK